MFSLCQRFNADNYKQVMLLYSEAVLRSQTISRIPELQNEPFIVKKKNPQTTTSTRQGNYGKLECKHAKL